MREPISVGQIGSGGSVLPLVVCNDGSAYYFDGQQWCEIQPVPGTLADQRSEGGSGHGGHRNRRTPARS